MSLQANALLTFADIQPILGLDTTMQSKYEYLINVASQYAEDFCGRKLAATTFTNKNLTYQSGNDYGRLLLPEYPVNSITSLNFDSTHRRGANSVKSAIGEIKCKTGFKYP